MNPVIGIIGAKGQMGQLFANFFQERGIEILKSDIGTRLTNKKIAQSSDIIIVSVPIDKSIEVINEITPHAKENAALMDFTGVKVKTVKAMLKAKSEVLGLHPMFGSTNPIPGQTVILCPTKKSGKWSKWIEKFLKDNGVVIEKMTPKEHDEMMSICQALIHFADISFIEALKNTNIANSEILKFSSSASRLKILLAARLIAQDPMLYGDMQIQNPYTLKQLQKYQKAIEKLIKIVKDKDRKKFKKYFLDCRAFQKKNYKEAYKDSSYLIDKYIEKKRTIKPPKTKKKPSKKNLAVLGPQNTYSDIAATIFLDKNKSDLTKFYTESLDQAYDLVESGKVKKGIVPIENKLHGSVRETLDALFQKKIHISQQVNIPIHHCLITLKHCNVSRVNKITSHPQAIAQCKDYLKKNFPKATKVTYTSTAHAINKLLKTNDLRTAVIASEAAAQNPKLKVIAKNIEDAPNSTTFIVIEKGNFKAKTNKQKKSKLSIAFHFQKDQPGSLFEVIEIIKKSKINMTKIESRPTRADFGDYIFYIDFEGNMGLKKVQNALKRIKKRVAFLKILGEY